MKTMSCSASVSCICRMAGAYQSRTSSYFGICGMCFSSPRRSVNGRLAIQAVPPVCSTAQLSGSTPKKRIQLTILPPIQCEAGS